MNEWKEYRFDEFVNVNPKVVFSKKENIAFVEMKDIDAANKFCTNSTYRNLSGGSRFENGDTLFARITPCLENGKIAQVRNLSDGKGLGSTEFHVLRGRPNISVSDFVYYLSRWKEVRDFAEINLHGTSGRQRFPAEAFKELILNLPGINEQQSIAEVLSSLDDKIDLLHRQKKTLEQMTETLFRQWFVEEAEESWEEKRLGDILTITSSKRIFYSEYVNSGIPFYRSKEIIELRNTGSTKSELYISNEKFEGINSKFGSPQKGDILMTSVGTLGVAYRVKNSTSFYFKDGNLTWFKDFKLLPSSIIYLWLISRIGQEELANITIGSTQEALTIEGLKSISFRIPPIEKIRVYEKQFDSILEKMDANGFQIQSLKNLRDILLPKLMNGSARVINN